MALSFGQRLGNLTSAFKQVFVGNDEAFLESQDRVNIANARPNNPGDTKPEKVHVKARHAGMIYNYSRSARYGSESYTPQEYDMHTIANAMDADSFFRRAIEKYVELIWKSGYQYTGKNPKAVKYLRKRLEQMAMTTSTPHEEFLRQISYQLVGYGNTYISKARDDKASGGRYRRTFTGQLLAPIAGYFVEDTVSIKLAFKENGEPIGYKQHIPGTTKAKVWRPWNMVHMYYSRKPGLRVGTPMVVPVLDDIRALRKLEQNIELLVFQHTVPLYHYKVGTDEHPGQDAEVAATKAEVEKMPPNGCIVTPERHEIKVIGAEGKALDATAYLEYFKKRVLAGLGMSSVSMGEGGTSNKSTSQVLDKHMINTTETFQRIIQMFFNEFVIKEILAEGGYVWDAFDEDNKVELFFPPVDKEEQRAKEQHLAQMYTQHQISESEMRKDIGRDIIEDDMREDMYLERIAIPISIINAPDESYTETVKTSTTTAGNTTNKTVTKLPKEPAANKGANIAKPTNQFGSKVKPTIAKNDALYSTVTNVYDATKSDVMEACTDYFDGDDPSFRVINTMERMVFGISKKTISDNLRGVDLEDKNFVERQTNKLFDELLNKMKPVFEMKNRCDAVSKISAIFESSRHKLNTLYLKEGTEEN